MNPKSGYSLVIAACMLWGTLGIFGKLAFEYGTEPQTLIALRLMVSSITLLLAVALIKRGLLAIKKKDIGYFLVLGLLAVALQRIAYFYAIDLTTATIAAMLYYTYPIIITIYTSLALKEKISHSTVLAILLAFLGVALVVRVYEITWLSANMLGVTFGALSGILSALFFLLTKKLRNDYTSWTLILYGDGIGAIALSPIVLSSFSKIANYPQQLWLLIFTIVWFPSLLAYLLYSYALKHVESSKGSILSVVEPLSAAIFSAAILSEKFEFPQVLGVALALIGITLLFYRPKLKR